jgi:AmmeMemoRadiSam system protein A
MLLDVAAASIEYAITENRPLQVVTENYPEPLREPRASFVTLRIARRLRGCMGSLQVTEPLVTNVARNAYAAAFRDPRFTAVTRAEFASLDIHLSLLTPPEPVECQSEAELLSLIRPGIDGLTLIEGPRRGTLLPSVWDTLTDPREFLAHLKHKTGLPVDYWSSTLRVERYTAESVGRDE